MDIIIIYGAEIYNTFIYTIYMNVRTFVHGVLTGFNGSLAPGIQKITANFMQNYQSLTVL